LCRRGGGGIGGRGMPDWRDEVVLAVRAWLAAEGGAGGSATLRLPITSSVLVGPTFGS
jgi:hypothetical protein